MTDYAAPVRDMSFVIEELIGLDTVATLPGLDWVTGDLVRQVLAEAGRFGAEVLAPLNRVGDIEGCALRNGVVTTPEGFADAYRQFTAGGWNGTIAAPDYGGQGLPWLVATAIGEIWESANLAFSLCPMLTQSAIWAISIHGSPEQKDIWLPRLVSGEWSGTMNLTEPHAGSDVGALRTRAIRADGHYRIKGPEDLHHLGRARHGREHRPHGARPRRRRAGGDARHLAVHRAQVPGQRGRLARARATISAAPRWSTSSASTRAPPR